MGRATLYAEQSKLMMTEKAFKRLLLDMAEELGYEVIDLKEVVPDEDDLP